MIKAPEEYLQGIAFPKDKPAMYNKPPSKYVALIFDEDDDYIDMYGDTRLIDHVHSSVEDAKIWVSTLLEKEDEELWDETNKVGIFKFEAAAYIRTRKKTEVTHYVDRWVDE